MRAKLKVLTFYLQRKRKPLLVALLPFSLFCFVFLLAPHSAAALDTQSLAFWDWGDAIGDFATGMILNIGMAALVFGVWTVNLALGYTNSFFTSQAIDSWNAVRTFTLGLFGIAVLIIAFMNLLKLQVQIWGVSRMIPKLFLTIFAVIFSKFICISIINFATALANTFKNGLSPSFNTSAFTDFNATLTNATTGLVAAKPSFLTAFAILLCSVVAMVVLFTLAIVLFFRAAVLVLLTVISPLAFSLIVLPWTQKYFQEWWKTFLKWTFFFPICIIILFIGFQMIPGNTPSPSPVSDGGTFFTEFGSLFIALVAIVMSVYLPLKMLGAFGSTAQDMLSGKKGIPGFNKGRRALLNPATYRRMFDARGDRKKVEVRGDIDQKMRKMSRGFDKIPKAGGAVGSWVTGFDKQSMNEYMESQAASIKKGIGYPKALGRRFQYLAALQAGDTDSANWYKSEFEKLATPQQRDFAEYKEKALGGGQNALDAYAVAYSNVGKGPSEIFTEPMTKKAMENVGVLKNNILSAPTLRGQNPWMSGKKARELGAPEFKEAEADFWIYAKSEHLQGVTDSLIDTWKQHSGATGKQFEAAARAFENNGMSDKAQRLRGKSSSRSGGQGDSPAGGQSGQTNTRPPGGGSSGASTWT